jgi:hypothetical protein
LLQLGRQVSNASFHRGNFCCAFFCRKSLSFFVLVEGGAEIANFLVELRLVSGVLLCGFVQFGLFFS